MPPCGTSRKPPLVGYILICCILPFRLGYRASSYVNSTLCSGYSPIHSLYDPCGPHHTRISLSFFCLIKLALSDRTLGTGVLQQHCEGNRGGASAWILIRLSAFDPFLCWPRGSSHPAGQLRGPACTYWNQKDGGLMKVLLPYRDWNQEGGGLMKVSLLYRDRNQERPRSSGHKLGRNR